MAITKQKYIIGGTLQTPTPWNRNIGFISAGGGAGAIVVSFQTLVTDQGGTIETFECTQNVVARLLAIDL
jgi:hypothetical protein